MEISFPIAITLKGKDRVAFDIKESPPCSVILPPFPCHMDLPDAKPPLSVSSIVDRAWNVVAETAFRTSWTPITRLAEAAVVAYVSNPPHPLEIYYQC